MIPRMEINSKQLIINQQLIIDLEAHRNALWDLVLAVDTGSITSRREAADNARELLKPLAWQSAVESPAAVR
jgi:hypothetical protein